MALATNGRRNTIYSVRESLGREVWWSTGKKQATQWAEDNAHKHEQYGPLTVYRCSPATPRAARTQP